MLEEKLEIFIITYNRCKSLQNTLNMLLDKKSPVKSLSITVLDNNSTDKTSQVVEAIQQKHSNLYYIKNKKNVGLSGNYCKALELVSKEYYWLIADDDSYNWSAWSEVEERINCSADFIIVSNIVPRILKNSKASAILASGWLPSVIIKSTYLSDDVVSYAYNEIATIYPQISVSCNLINKGSGNLIKVVSKDIVSYGNKAEDTRIKDFKSYDFNRIESDKKIIHPRLKFYNYYSNLILACRNIKDDDVFKEMLFWLLASKDCHIRINDVWVNIFLGNTSKVLFTNMFVVLPFEYQLKFILGFFTAILSFLKKIIKEKRRALKKSIKQIWKKQNES